MLWLRHIRWWLRHCMPKAAFLTPLFLSPSENHKNETKLTETNEKVLIAHKNVRMSASRWIGTRKFKILMPIKVRSTSTCQTKFFLVKFQKQFEVWQLSLLYWQSYKQSNSFTHGLQIFSSPGQNEQNDLTAQMFIHRFTKQGGSLHVFKSSGMSFFGHFEFRQFCLS